MWITSDGSTSERLLLRDDNLRPSNWAELPKLFDALQTR